MTSQIVSAIKGTTIRVMTLNVCGNIVTGGSSSQVVETGFISVKPSPQYEDGQEFVQKTASGFLCVNQKDPGQLKRVNTDSLWCVMNPDLITIMTGARLIAPGGVTGTGNFFTDALLASHFSLEIWQQIAGRNACNAAGQQQFLYWAFFHNQNAQVGDFTIENSNLQFDMKAETAGVGSIWGGFPTAAPPSGYLGSATILPGDHYAYNITTVAPPASTNGAVTVT